MSSDDSVKPVRRSKKKGKKASTSSKSLPAFLQKLYSCVDRYDNTDLHSIVSDPELDDRIHWSENGDSFVVPSQEKVSQEILPQYFKHSNFGSFVRQLNMYGFRKVPQMQSGAQKTAYAGADLVFKHDLFQRDHPELMSGIERKKGGDDGEKSGPAKSANVQALMSRLEAVQERQELLSQEFEAMATTNHQLWTEQQKMQTKHEQQQQTINAIVRFLAQNYKGQISGFDGIKDLPSPGAVERFTQMNTEANGVHPPPQRMRSFNRLLLEGPEAPSRLQELRSGQEAIANVAEQKDSPNSQNGDGRFSTLPESPPNGQADSSALFGNMDPSLSAVLSSLAGADASSSSFQNAFAPSRALPAPPAASTSHGGALVPYQNGRPVSEIQADMAANQRDLDALLADLDTARFSADAGQDMLALDDIDFSQFLDLKQEEETPVLTPPLLDPPTPRTRSQTATPGPSTRTSPRKRPAEGSSSASKRTRA